MQNYLLGIIWGLFIIKPTEIKKFSVGFIINKLNVFKKEKL